MVSVLLQGCRQHLKLYVKEFVRTWFLKKHLGKKGPQKEPPAWMHEQIKADLAPFSPMDVSVKAIDRAWSVHHQEWELLRVRIKNNRLSLLCHCPDAFRISYLKGGLEALLRWTALPDVDFLLSLSDSLDGISPEVPIFTFANNPTLSSRVVLMPDREALSGRYWKFHRSVQKGNLIFPWEKKIEQCSWRGMMTGGQFTPLNFLSFPRSQAISLSLENPDWLDAKYVASAQQKKGFEEYRSYFGHPMSIEEQIQYKYQLLIDGNSCAYSRAYWQLFSNCLLFKQQSDAVQWYYRALLPFVHYVPVGRDLSNLLEALSWAKSHDENLSIEKVFQYMYLLILEYSKLQQSS